MSGPEVNIHVLDAAYEPFPTFAEWAARTSVDTVRWDRYSAELKNRPASSSDALKRAYEIVKRAAALDTGAIEGLYEVDRGFTFTVAFETAAWEVELAKKGENVRPLFEAQLHAYDFVLDLATKAEPISEAAVRKLHEVVCAAQDTYRVMTAVGPQEQSLTKGRYKVLPNHVRTRDGLDHSYAPVDMTPPEMARLVAEMRTDAFLTAHPVVQAAYAHYGLVVIHPFADGNGRVARALASVFTYRAISMPIMILSDRKELYLDALEESDRGRYLAFVDFLMDRLIEARNVVLESLRLAGLPSAEESLVAIKELSATINNTTEGELAEEQLDEAGERLLAAVERALQGEVVKLPADTINASVKIVAGVRIGYTATHRATRNGGQGLNLDLTSLRPSLKRTEIYPYAFVWRRYDLLVPRKGGRDDEVQLRREDGRDVFSVRICEIVPAISSVLQIRISIFVKRVIDEALSEFKTAIERSAKARSSSF